MRPASTLALKIISLALSLPTVLLAALGVDPATFLRQNCKATPNPLKIVACDFNGDGLADNAGDGGKWGKQGLVAVLYGQDGGGFGQATEYPDSHRRL